MNHPFVDWLEKTGKFEPDSLHALTRDQKARPFSLYREVSFLFYAGLLILCSGLGILVYEHIGELGHILFLLLIFGSSLFGLGYAHLRFPPFSWEKTEAPSLLMSYLVLGCCMLFLVGEGYFEYRFQVFEERFQILSGLSAIFCFVIAYRFDHQGVLSIALSSASASVGLTILPGKWFMHNLDRFSLPMASSAILFGGVLLAAGFIFARQGKKAHFEITYAAIGSFLVLAGLLWLQSFSETKILYSLLCLLVAGLLFLYAKRIKSVFIYVLVVFSAYFSITALFVSGLSSDFIALMVFYYGPVSLAGITFLLVKYKRILNLK